jgi:hypothetical protein
MGCRDELELIWWRVFIGGLQYVQGRLNRASR